MADSQGKAWGHTSSTAKPSSSQVKEGVHTASVPALLSPPPDFLFTNNLRFVTVTRFHVDLGTQGPARGEETDLPASSNLCSCHWCFLNQHIYAPKYQDPHFQEKML